MIAQYAERLIHFKVAYLAAWPQNLGFATCERLYATANPAAQIRRETDEDGGRFVLEPKRLQYFTPRFQLVTSKMAGPQEEARQILFSGADAVVVVAREHEAEDLLHKAHAAVAALPQSIPIVVQVEGGLSPEWKAVLETMGLVRSSAEEALTTVIEDLVARASRLVPNPGAAVELSSWKSVPFSRGPKAEVPLFDENAPRFVQTHQPMGPNPLQQQGISPKMMWAGIIAILALLLAASVRLFGWDR